MVETNMKIFENKKKIIFTIIMIVVICFIINHFFGGEGRFVRTGDMVIPRFGHSAVLLNDGRVLITGGYWNEKGHNNTTAPKSAEIYNPKTGKFTRTGDMHFGRAYHSTILLNDGKVLVVGGGPQQAELYNPETSKFSVTGSLPVKFFNAIGEQASVIKLKNGEIFIIEGVSKDGTTWIIKYSPKNEKFNLVKKTKLYHGAQNAILLQDGNILIVGGYKPQKAEIYNPDTKQLTFTNNENDIIGSIISVLLDKNIILLIENFKNNNMKLFDINHNTFNNINHPEYWDCKGICTATLLNNGKVLIIGIDKNKQKLYDPDKDRFINTKRVKLSHLGQAATLLQNGNVLITGGKKPKIVMTSSNTALLYKIK